MFAQYLKINCNVPHHDSLYAVVVEVIHMRHIGRAISICRQIEYRHDNRRCGQSAWRRKNEFVMLNYWRGIELRGCIRMARYYQYDNAI